jgi:GT2 family glycosyltransferase
MRKKLPKTFPKASNATRSLARSEPVFAADTDERSQAPAPFSGYVDIFGYSSAAGGWLFNGWVSRPLNLKQLEPVEFLAQYEKSQCWGRAILAFYQRDDLDQKSIGVIAFVPSTSRVVGGLQHVAFSFDGFKYQAQAGHFTTRLLDQEIVDRVRVNLANQAFANRNRDHLLAITARSGFTGHDSLSSLSETVLLEVDEAIFCPPGGVLIKGWQLSGPGVLRNIRVRSGPLAGDMALSDAIRVDRPDVIAAVGPHTGFSAIRCGFIAYVPSVVSSGDASYLEVELENGEVGFKNLKLSKRTGVDAIQRILEGVDIRSGEIDTAFDKTLGPAVSSINQARLQNPVIVAEIEFGVTSRSPLCSVIIPLYRRVDFVEYQMALFSRSWDSTQIEILYVLDDPAKRRELEILARSIYERFRIPFRLLLLESNVGFAAANNVGLRAAQGRFICFLNSDIFPITDHWIEGLVKGLERNPDLGIIGARLLFEDGSVQHEGCYYSTLGEFGNWTFVEHLNKGLRPDDSQDIQRRDAITGACMVMKHSLALELGGFDEQFIIGDFEDSDLCLKAKARGLSCAVDMGVHMYHLERKSQSSPGESWRMNLTLYNAWVHQRRWQNAATPLSNLSLESM